VTCLFYKNRKNGGVFFSEGALTGANILPGLLPLLLGITRTNPSVAIPVATFSALFPSAINSLASTFGGSFGASLGSPGGGPVIGNYTNTIGLMQIVAGNLASNPTFQSDIVNYYLTNVEDFTATEKRIETDKGIIADKNSTASKKAEASADLVSPNLPVMLSIRQLALNEYRMGLEQACVNVAGAASSAGAPITAVASSGGGNATATVTSGNTTR
jgi:hypothetical protein